MSCRTLEAKAWPDKDPASKLDYEVDFTDALSRKWGTSDKNRTSGVFIRVSKDNGYDFECTTAGRSGAVEPRWPKTIGATIPDGSAVWTCRAPSTSSLVTTVSSVAWVSPDTSVVITNETLSGQIAKAWIAGGADGQDYTLMVTATCADAEGSTIAQPCILPVRRAKRVCVA